MVLDNLGGLCLASLWLPQHFVFLSLALVVSVDLGTGESLDDPKSLGTRLSWLLYISERQGTMFQSRCQRVILQSIKLINTPLRDWWDLRKEA